jgi:hypothetical protein
VMRSSNITRVEPCFTREEVDALRNAIARAIREAHAAVNDAKRAHACMAEALGLQSIRRKLNLCEQHARAHDIRPPPFDFEY